VDWGERRRSEALFLAGSAQNLMSRKAIPRLAPLVSETCAERAVRQKANSDAMSGFMESQACQKRTTFELMPMASVT
jgi:hypothetical protein